VRCDSTVDNAQHSAHDRRLGDHSMPRSA
jgi:hypothetical protein